MTVTVIWEHSNVDACLLLPNFPHFWSNINAICATNYHYWSRSMDRHGVLLAKPFSTCCFALSPICWKFSLKYFRNVFECEEKRAPFFVPFQPFRPFYQLIMMFALTLGRSGKNVISSLRHRYCVCWLCYTFVLPIYLFLFRSCFKTHQKILLVFSVPFCPSSSSSGSFLHFLRVFTSSPKKSHKQIKPTQWVSTLFRRTRACQSNVSKSKKYANEWRRTKLKRRKKHKVQWEYRVIINWVCLVGLVYAWQFFSPRTWIIIHIPFLFIRSATEVRTRDRAKNQWF